MVSRLVIGGAKAFYAADCCQFYSAYCGACCGCWCCFRQILVFVDNHITISPSGQVADVGERDFGPLSSLAGATEDGGVELANRQQQPQQHAQASRPPAAWTQPAPEHQQHIATVALPRDADDFLRVIPSLQASLEVSLILLGMRDHRMIERVQDRACQALMEITPKVAGEEYAKILLEAGQDLTKLMGTYTKMTQLGVVEAVVGAMSEHSHSKSIAANACSIISFLARADSCRDLIAREVHASGQGTCGCLILTMREHKTDGTIAAWGCHALNQIATDHPGNVRAVVQAGGPSVIQTVMHQAPFNHQLIACGCRALGTLVTSRPFSADYVVDQQAVQIFLDVMQQNAGNSASNSPEGHSVEYACGSLYKISTTHRNLLAYMKEADSQQCLANILTLPSASAKVKEQIRKLLDLLDGINDISPSAPTLPAQSSQPSSVSPSFGTVIDSSLVFETAPAPRRATFCGKCGQPLSADNSFCTRCGAPVG